MEDKKEYLEGHQEREVRTLTERIEKTAEREAARVEETARALDDYARKVGS